MQAYSYDRRIARLVQKHREDKNRDEWALIESDGPKVLKWFGATKPSDEAVAKEEARIQSFKNKGAKDKIPGGLADKGPPKGVDPKQVAKGVKVEMEHTTDPAVAREIAHDHLTEDPTYYDKLETIEKHASLTMVEYEYGQWKDEGGRWAIKRRREPTETFVAHDLKGKWSSPPGSLSEAMEALKVKAKTDVTFQHQRYSYDRRRNKLVEHRFRSAGVGGSSPLSGSSLQISVF